MASRLETLTSYVPALALRRLAQDPTPLTQAVEEPMQAAILFADLSGFTMLAERLAQRADTDGASHGAEELANLLNLYFGQLIEIIYEHGGDVAEFAGDALLAIWTVEDPSQLAAVVSKAAQCGLTAQACLNNYPVATGIPLSLRIGVGVGQVSAMHVGGAFGHWKIFVNGEPVVQAILAQQQAEPGKVVLSRAAHQLVQELCTGTAMPNGNMLVWAVRSQTLPIKPQLPQLNSEAEISLLSYLPGAIVSRLLTGSQQAADTPQAEWLAELRYVTVLFINLPDLTCKSDLDSIQQAVRRLQMVLYRYECSVNKVSMSETGLQIVAALGLPPLAHEDDPIRALHTAFALQDDMRSLGVGCAVGITSGRVFSGSVGNELRREYTLIGDVVNVSARLMRLALPTRNFIESSLILCDAPTYHPASARFAFEHLPSIVVKGKSGTMDVYRLLREDVARPQVMANAAILTGARTPIVGRLQELDLLNRRLYQLTHGGEGYMIMFQGESGIGKSRLLEEAKYLAENSKVTVFTLVGDPLERATPYRAWRTVFSRLLDLDVLSDPDSRRQHVLSLLDDFRDVAPLLNVVMPLELEDNEFTKDLTGQKRSQATNELLLEILSLSVSKSPKVFLVEDAHWFDSRSWDLMLALMRSPFLKNLLLVVALRPFSEEAPPPEYAQLRELPNVTYMYVHPLSSHEALTLARQQWGVSVLSHGVANLILEKTEGNPFYIAELTYALRDTALVTIQDGECRTVHGAASLNYLHFPNTVQGVITSRIDRLPPPQQLTLKVASIIGREFTFSVLSEVYPVPEEVSRLNDYLHEMERLDLLKIDPDAAEPTYVFKHTLTQEVTYGLMLFSQRRDLHRKIGFVMERLYADRLSEIYGALGRHFLHGETWDKAYHYMVLAGDAAVRLNAESHARFYYAQALESLKHLSSSVQNHRRYRDVALKYAQLSWSINPAAQNLEFLGTAESLSKLLPDYEARDENDVLALAQVELWITRLRLISNDFPTALSRTGAALPRMRELGNKELLIDFLAQQGQALIVQGKLAEAATPLSEARSLLEGSADESRWAQVLAPFIIVAVVQHEAGGAMAAGQYALLHAQRSTQWFDKALVYFYLALGYALENNASEMKTAAQTLLELARKAENPLYLALGYYVRGWAEQLAEPNSLAAHETFQTAATFGKVYSATLMFDHWFASARVSAPLPIVA